MYGWRGRLGRLTPSAAVNGEQEWARALPEGMIVVTARMYIEQVTPDALETMMTQLRRAATEVASAGADVVMQCGTPAVALKDPAYEREVIAVLEETTKKPAGTMAMAVVEALRCLGARRVAVATPYLEEVGERVVQFLRNHGFEIAASRHLGIRRNADIGALPPQASYQAGRAVAAAAGGADAVFISCGNFRTFDVLEALEEDCGAPVVSSNLAGLWKSLRLMGYRQGLAGLGTLLRDTAS